MRTSPDNYQAWLTLGKSATSQDSLLVARELTERFRGDMNSVQTDQQGRLPGTTNIKDGKGCVAVLTHSERQNMDETSYLKLTSGKRFALKDGALRITSQPPSRNVQGTIVDRSAQDWKMCCTYFESNREANIEDAAAALGDK